ncbi:MAG: hypothetical protein M1816_006987 [Peltula sp. TS41687]|nr:MAG: hypothetical protein M1816_006987 [Peltula sp. TS41687]
MSSVRRACDACHRRKVRCDGKMPCRHCTQASLICTFDAIPKKKGPRGNQARVISEIRDAQQRANLALKLRDSYDGSDGLSTRSAWAPTPGLLSRELVDACTNFFFDHMYPTMPILHRERFYQTHVRNMGFSLESYCLVCALCAFMMIQPGMILPGVGTSGAEVIQDGTPMGRTLLEEALRVRKGYDYVESLSAAPVITSFFLFGSHFCLDKHKVAWFHLREATTLAQILDMHVEDTYHTGDMVECIRRRRLYWLLFVTERAYALQKHHPLTLFDSIAMPTIDEDPSERLAVSGFIYLVNLFRPFDQVFVGLWNKTRQDCSTAWLGRLQGQLANALPTHLESTESQAADLRTSQQWLRNMVWTLSITNGYLSTSSADTSMTFKFPVEIARDLVTVTGELSKQSMEVHGIGLIEKLFDVACTLTDVMACVPMGSTSLEIGPHDYLNHFLTLISTLRGGQARYLPLLLTKVNDVMSTMAGPIIPLLSFDEPQDGRVEEQSDGSNSSRSSRLFVPPSLSTASSDMSMYSTSSFNDSVSTGLGPSPLVFEDGFMSGEELEYLR